MNSAVHHLITMGVKLHSNFPRSKATKSEQDKNAEALSKHSRGRKRLMIIKLRKYSEVRELLIGYDTKGLIEQVIYQDTGPEGVCN